MRNLNNFIVVAGSWQMNSDRISNLCPTDTDISSEQNASWIIKEWIHGQPKKDCQMLEYDKGNGQGLLLGYA
ncbi:MAG: hypothetical protein NC115_10245 [Bacteroidales bacterium]|nr:hypothetical protein [Bacteroidales bacterium]